MLIYGVAISASIAVLMVMLASVSWLPALLACLGPRVDSLRLPLIGRRLTTERTGGDSPAARWSHAVQRRPRTSAIAATAVLLALATPALGMRIGFPDAGNDPSDMMTRKAYDLNTEGFHGGGGWGADDRARGVPLASRGPLAGTLVSLTTHEKGPCSTVRLTTPRRGSTWRRACRRTCRAAHARSGAPC
jgi:RND superfamily putative drug exporter